MKFSNKQFPKYDSFCTFTLHSSTNVQRGRGTERQQQQMEAIKFKKLRRQILIKKLQYEALIPRDWNRNQVFWRLRRVLSRWWIERTSFVLSLVLNERVNKILRTLAPSSNIVHLRKTQRKNIWLGPLISQPNFEQLTWERRPNGGIRISLDGTIQR